MNPRPAPKGQKKAKPIKRWMCPNCGELWEKKEHVLAHMEGCLGGGSQI